MLLVVENGSSYTGRLLQLLRSESVSFRAVPHREAASADGFDSVILSGRRLYDRSSNAQNSRMVRHCVGEGKPLLGICYGAEILATTMGGTLRPAASFRSEMRQVRVARENPLAGGTLRVMASHGYEIARLPETLERIASSEECRHEIIRVRGADVFGTQFHPEATPDGRALILRFLGL